MRTRKPIVGVGMREADTMLLRLRDYVRLVAPEPEILRLIGEASVRQGTDKLTSRQIDLEIKAARASARKRR